MTSSSSAASASRLALIILAVAVGVGASLRVAHLVNRGDLWIDEAITASLTTHNPIDLSYLFTVPKEVTSTILHAHPPLYYSLLGPWTSVFGRSELVLRSFSLLFGLASVLLLWRLARAWLDPHIASLSAALLAIAPIHIHYSCEARYYTLFLFLTLGALHAFFAICRSDPRSARPYLFYTLCNAASIYTFYYGFFPLLVFNLVFALGVVTGRLRSADRIWRWTSSQLAVALLFLPWAGVMHHQYTNMTGSSFSSWTEFGPAMRSVLVGLTAYGASGPAAHLTLAILLLLAAGGVASLRTRPLELTTLILWFSVPILLHRWVGTVKIVGRVFLFTTPALYILAACAVAHALRKPRRPIAAATLLLAGALVVLSGAAGLEQLARERSLRASLPSLGQLGAEIRRSGTRDAVLLLEKGKEVFQLEYYVDSPIPVIGFPAGEARRLGKKDASERQAQSVAKLGQAFDQLWIFGGGGRADLLDPTHSGDGRRLKPEQTLRFRKAAVRVYSTDRFAGQPTTGCQPPREGGSPNLERLVFFRLDSPPELRIALTEPSLLRWFVVAQYPEERPFFGWLELRVDGEVVDAALVGCDYASVSLLEASAGAGAHTVSVTLRPGPREAAWWASLQRAARSVLRRGSGGPQ